MRYIIFSLAVIVGAAVIARAPLASAETFVLTSGGKIEGKWLNRDQSPRIDYSIQVASGGKILLDKASVEQVIAKSEAQLWYEKHLPQVANTVDSHWHMSEECLKRKLTSEREFHLNAILTLDPNHEKARYGLGYSRVNGNWVRQEEQMLRRGYVRFQNRWCLPQEVELEKRGDNQALQEGEWRKKIKLWRGWIVKCRDKALEGQRLLSEINDVSAAKPLAELLDEDKEPVPMKLLYVDILSRLPTSTSVSALMKRSLYDPDVNVRDRSIDGLEKLGARELVPALVKSLKHEQNYVVQRAALVLGRLKASEATLPLVDALTTKHKHQISSGGQTSAGFDKNSGSGGLSFGGGPKIVEVEQRNEQVLAALVSIHRGVNNGYDKIAWKRWYSLQRAPKEVSLRRGE